MSREEVERLAIDRVEESQTREGFLLDGAGIRRLFAPAIDVAYQAAGLEQSPHDPVPAEGEEG